MVNKKGFVRTLESVIAVIVVLTFIYVITLKTETPTGEVPFNIKDAQKFIFQEVSFNDNYRQCIMSSSPGSTCPSGCLNQIDQLIISNRPAGFNHACEVCSTALSCSTSLGLPVDKSVYTDSIFISRDKFRILRVYFWEA